MEINFLAWLDLAPNIVILCGAEHLLVYLFEMAIDVIKHSFIAKFNNISPVAYSEFLEVLCKQVL